MAVLELESNTLAEESVVDPTIRSQFRAAKVLFFASKIYLLSQLAIQLIECARRGSGVGIGSPASPGRKQDILTSSAAAFQTAHDAHGFFPQFGLFVLWISVCVVVVWAFYAFLSRLRSF